MKYMFRYFLSTIGLTLLNLYSKKFEIKNSLNEMALHTYIRTGTMSRGDEESGKRSLGLEPIFFTGRFILCCSSASTTWTGDGYGHN